MRVEVELLGGVAYEGGFRIGDHGGEISRFRVLGSLLVGALCAETEKPPSELPSAA